MRLVFISDYISIHQIALCNAFYKMLGKDFIFVATTHISEARKKMGWRDFTDEVPYAVHSDAYTKEELKEILNLSDVVIIGSSHAKGLDGVLRKKNVFYYQERPLKKGIAELKNPRRLYAVIRMILRQSKRIHLLAASAFSASDYRKLACFKGRAWKWGYFIDPICTEYTERKNERPKILWVSRMIPWKCGNMAISAAKYLREKGCDFELNMIGDGPERVDIEAQIKEYGLEEYVRLLGNMPNDDVRKYMQNVDIFLFTSNKNEGWGVVLNEAMSAGCCVIASNAIGSAPFLISDGENGMLFESENQNSLNEKLLKAVTSPNLCQQMGKKALYDLNEIWGPDNAAISFLKLCETLSQDRKLAKNCCKVGPCSPA